MASLVEAEGLSLNAASCVAAWAAVVERQSSAAQLWMPFVGAVALG